MNYYKVNIQSIFCWLFIASLFFSDFGILVAGQSIYFFQILAFGFIAMSVFFNLKIEKGWLIFFLATFVATLVNSSILAESRQFAGDTYPITSIKAIINIFLFYATYKTTIYAYFRINPNLFLILSLIMIFYGFLELFLSTNSFVREFLLIFHTNPKALDKGTLSLLGREHSYGSMGYMIAVCILLHCYFKNYFSGYKKYLSILCMAILTIFVIIAKSKSIYIGVLALTCLIIFLMLRQKKLTYSSVFILLFSSVALMFVVTTVIANNFFFDALESVSGDIGSGSTFIRFTNLYVAFTIWLDNPFFGVGPGNYKLFYVEHVYKSGIPIILELATLTDPYYSSGSIDPSNFFAGILSEFGIITFIVVFYIIFKRVLYLAFDADLYNKKISLSLLISPIVFGASFGFYYWAVSYFPFFLALLSIDYKNTRILK